MNCEINGSFMDKISVIIPVYNVESYLRKCLDSVLNQTYKNLEILLINDGSTDNSGSICDEYGKKDSRIRVFHKENGGASSARNVGLRELTGDYIGFVDSDDWLEPQMYEVLYKALIDNNVHLSNVSFTRNAVPEKRVGDIPSGMLTSEQMLLYAIRNFHYAGFGRVIWNKLFKADMIVKSKVIFDESIEIAEDLKILAELYLAFECTGVFVDKILYHHLHIQNSLMHSGKISRDLDELRCYKELCTAMDKRGLQDISKWLKRQHCYNASVLLEEKKYGNDVELKAFLYEEMKIYINEYMEINSAYPDRIERIQVLSEK